MINFKRNEIFEVQQKLYQRLSGVFGLSPVKRTAIAVALDAAVAFGMLLERYPGQVVAKPDDEMLLASIREKILRL